ncbi:hypothetical protein [Actinomadura sp. HBU206391]|uniref:hypothetical protein n=1 Tax=Actinomadura sp. HBU206391 TaxID=2731692 RepID=UPI0016504754|nr:hypothetical protein [Actinomadura sp. HBU206391]MBC6458962.1 hypothetical protein [Actinomadura sp. HBU206391]
MLLVVTVVTALVMSRVPGGVTDHIQDAVCRVGDAECADPRPGADVGPGAEPVDGSLVEPGAGVDDRRDAETAYVPSGPPPDGAASPDEPADTYWSCGWGQEFCDFGQGIYRGTWDIVTGTWDGVTFIGCLVHICSHGAFKDGWSGIGSLFTTNPIDTLKSMWDDSTKDIREDWNNDHHGTAAGRAVPAVLGMVGGVGWFGRGTKLLKSLRRTDHADTDRGDADATRKAGDEYDRSQHDPDRRDLDANYPPTEKEVELREREVAWDEPLLYKDGKRRENDVYKIHFKDDSDAVYKPQVSETSADRKSIPKGGLAYREVAAYRLSELLGWDLVPTTTLWSGPKGIGSLQDFVDKTDGSFLPHSYTRLDQDRMAAFDYIIGNTDRHRGNYLTVLDGRIKAVDHGLSFPEDSQGYIRSNFLAEYMERPPHERQLSPEVIADIKAIDIAELRRMLRGSGLSPGAVDGALDRLNELRSRGEITGEAWRGAILDVNFETVRKPLQ